MKITYGEFSEFVREKKITYKVFTLCLEQMYYLGN